MVVASIIILAAAIAVPALGPMMTSNQMAEAIGTLNGLLTTAQAAAKAQGTPVGLRIERAFRTTSDGFMDKSTGWPWLDHQQVRILEFATTKQVVFRYTPGSKVQELPAGVWLAPGYCVRPSTPEFQVTSLAETHLLHTPADANAMPYNRFDTFFVVFNRDGELTRFEHVEPATGAGKNWYEDRAQAYWAGNDVFYPYVDHPDDSARSVLAYDRKVWDGINPGDGAGRLEFLGRDARVVHINRATGAIVEGSPP